MKVYKVINILLFLTIIISCNTNNKENATIISTKRKPKINIKEKVTDNKTVLNLGTFGNFKDTLGTIYLKNGGVNAVVNWASINLKKGCKVKFLKSDTEGPKMNMIITVSNILIEKLDSQGNETGIYYLGNPNQIDYENSDLFYSYRENYKNEKYNLVIYIEED